MSVIAFPTTLYASKISWSQQRADVEFRGTFGAQATEVSPPMWMITIEAPNMRDSSSAAGAWKALVMQLRGKTNQLSMYDPKRPAPLGTMRGAPTLKSAAAQGDVTFTITGGYATAGTTLLQGDLLGLGSGTTQQVVMVTADTAASAETRSLALDFAAQTYAAGTVGDLAVTFEPPLRNAFDAAAAVTWDKPRALFRRTDSNTGWDYMPGAVSGFGMQLIEDWRP